MIGLGAFWLSFTALADLARRAGTASQLSWVWPLIVDGVIVVATISVVALSRHGRRATRYPWLLLAGGAAVSVSANVTHALVVADTTVPPLLAALVASVPPIVLLAITHLTVELARYQRTPVRADRTRAERPVLSPMPVPRKERASTMHLTEPYSATSVRARKAARQLGIPTTATPVERASSGKGTARRLREEGLSNRRIAARLGVHPSTVGRWLSTPAQTTSGNSESAQVTDENHEYLDSSEGEDDDHS